MTREEAIELLEDLDGAIEDNHGRDYDEAFRMAIEALKADDRPTKIIAEIKVDTEEVVKRIKEEYEIADRPRGEWIDFVSQVEGRFKECDQCGERIYLSTFYENDYNYCPNCGARMRGLE